jgi:hypothetical protein
MTPDSRSANQALWRQYVLPLGKKYLTMFEAADERRDTELYRRVIQPGLFTGETYIALDLITKRDGRNHDIAEEVASGRHHETAWRACEYFTNAMTVDDPNHSARPTDRSLFTGSVVFTFEFDRDEVAFLKEQLDWLPRAASWRGCRMGELFDHCSQFPDFEGLTVNWAGNKSLHIHAVFSTAPYRNEHGEVASPARGLSEHWRVLADDVVRILAPSPKSDGKGGQTPMLPDSTLSSPIAYRRLPGGHRKLLKANLLGMPAGMLVPQIVLCERYRKRARQESATLFFSPSRFASIPESRVAPANRIASTIGETLTPEQICYCSDALREFFPGPDGFIFHDLSFDRSQNQHCARFYNGLGDKTPSSVMYETHRTVLVNGAAVVPEHWRDALPCSLGQFIALLCDRLARETAERECHSDDDSQRDDEGNLSYLHDDPGSQRIGVEFRDAFGSTVVDSATAQATMQEHLPRLVETEGISLVRGPEGCSKTTSLFKRHADIMSRLRNRGFCGLAAYGFADYDNVIEKIEGFNSINRDGKYVAVMWPSFSRTYEMTCSKLNVVPITDDERRKRGHRSLWAMVESTQPEIIEEFRRLHRTMWDEIGDREPVIFTVHQVVQNVSAVCRPSCT